MTPDTDSPEDRTQAVIAKTRATMNRAMGLFNDLDVALSELERAIRSRGQEEL